MFTGIVQAQVEVKELEKKPDLFHIALELPSSLRENIELGASIALDGVCLTVTSEEDGLVTFDAMGTTLSLTTLGNLEIGSKVNVERAARFGDEIGGHLLSGHILGTCEIAHIETSENNQKNTFRCPTEWMKYILPKGYIALDGASLTIVDTTPSQGTFTVSFIPETLERTTFGWKEVGDRVNLEIDSQTQTVVDTVERVLAE